MDKHFLTSFERTAWSKAQISDLVITDSLKISTCNVCSVVLKNIGMKSVGENKDEHVA